jgi:hypothetical protein
MMAGKFPHDPKDHSGEPLKMHSQPADNSASDSAEGGEVKKDRKDSVAQEGGNPHGEPKKGDGTMFVK